MRDPVLLVLLPFILIYISRSGQGFGLIVWDTQTGVIVGEPKIECGGRLMFHGDQRTITIVTRGRYLNTHNVFNGMQLCQEMALPQGTWLGAHWIHKDSLQLVTGVKTNENLVINIWRLQPTSTHPLCILSTFFVPPYEGGFTFSSTSFHACFFSEKGTVILDVRNSKPLLHITPPHAAYQPLGQFSPDGKFFACVMISSEICVWQNTPAGYVPWNKLRPKLPIWGFLWSPTATSILCQCTGGILLLDPVNHPIPLSLDGNELDSEYRAHLVTYSVDQMHIAVAQKGGGVVKVLKHPFSETQQFVRTEMKIHDIKIINNTVFAVDMHKLVGWDLKVGEGGLVSRFFWPAAHLTGRTVVDKTLAIGTNVEQLRLSHDCSQIAFAREGKVFLYDIKAQEVLKSIEQEWDMIPKDIQFSPDGHQLWIAGHNSSNTFCFAVDLTGEDQGYVDLYDLKDGWSWANHFSSCRYHVGKGSAWVVDSKGRKPLWLLPNWRVSDWKEVRWHGNSLALVSAHNPVPIIIHFQPQHVHPYSH